MAIKFDYYSNWNSEELICEKCGHKNKAGDCSDLCSITGSIVFDCANCDESLGMLYMPSQEQAEQAARNGNPEAIKDLESNRVHKDRVERVITSQLKNASQIPQIEGTKLHLCLDLVNENEETYFLLKHGDDIIWKELVFYEETSRFREILDILREKYGDRLKSLISTSSAERSLLGDSGRGITKWNKLP